MLLGPPPLTTTTGPQSLFAGHGVQTKQQAAAAAAAAAAGVGVGVGVAVNHVPRVCAFQHRIYRVAAEEAFCFFDEHGRLLFFRLKLHHVDATSRHVDFMSISNSDVLERGSHPSWMSIEVWNLIWMCTQDMYILCCLIPL